jgi:homoserine dehydrogenase
MLFFVLQIESLYPTEFGPSSMSTEDFLSKGLSQLDEKLKARVTSASANGNVLRYVCVVENLRLVTVYFTNNFL